MKWIWSLTFLLSLNTFSQIQQEHRKFNIDGKIEGQNTGIVVLGYFNSKRQVINDTCILKDGIFTFSGFVNEPTLAFLSGNVKSRSLDDLNRTELFIEPSNMSIRVKANDFKHAKIIGSFTQDEMSTIKKIKDSLYDVMGVKDLQSTYMELAYKLAKDKENLALQNQTQNAYNQLHPFREALKKAEIEFASRHPKSYLSPYLLRFYYAKISADSLRKIYDSLDYDVQNSFSGKMVKEQIIKKYGVGEGNAAINFRYLDSKGEVVELSSLIKNQKLILLDFWASWCIPCRQGNPNLIKLYKKYKASGFEIIGVSSDSNETDWKKAIAKDSIGVWYQLLARPKESIITNNSLTSTNESDIFTQYLIGVLPTKVLIGKSGTIISRIEGGEDELLSMKLKEIFGF